MKRNTDKRTKIWLAVLLVPLSFVPLLAMHFDPASYRGGRSRDYSDRLNRNTSAAGMLFGELRTSMSDILYLKTERYLHSGVAYESHLGESAMGVAEEADQIDQHEEEVQEGGEHDHDAHSSHDHSDHIEDEGGAATVIRTAEEDFRGFIGHLHREVKPYLDPSESHKLTTGEELLPWYRVMTMADPHYIRGYTTGGWWLKRTNIDKAIGFLEEGIELNPDAFQLHYMLGTVYYQMAQNLIQETDTTMDSPEAQELFDKAVVWYRQAAEYGLEQRPKDWEFTTEWAEEWDHYREDDLRASIRLAVLYEKRYGDADEAMRLARKYLAAVGGDPILERNLRKMETGVDEESFSKENDTHDHEGHAH